MKYIEGTIFKKKLRNIGGSLAFIVDPAMQEYLGLDSSNKYVEIAIKCDTGKWGRFIGFGKVVKEDIAEGD